MATDTVNSEPSVSVVIPCRNEKSHIEDCVRSILAQEEPQGGFEVIVADGLSDDGTDEILRRLAAADHRLRVVKNPGRITSCGMMVGEPLELKNVFTPIMGYSPVCFRVS